MKIKAKKEGRDGIWLPERESLKGYIVAKKIKTIHNFVYSGVMMIGADHDVKSVLEDIDKADRIAIFTDHKANMGHSMALIKNDKLECYDIGEIKESDLIIED